MKMQRKKLSTAIGLVVTTLYAGGAMAQEAIHSEDEIVEVVVTAAFQQSEAETAMPVGVLDGEALRERIGNSLGETLQNEIGVNTASFGTGVGHPVIRGQTGNRVKILQNGVGTTDAAALSPDHAEAVNTQLAERLEVIRGPSALLYGSGAVGGVVNVIDNRIPESLPAEPSLVLQQTRDNVSNQDQTLIRIDAAAGNVAFHLDAFTSRNDNVEIPGYAIDEEAVEELEELIHEHLEEGHEDDHDDDHDEDHEDDHDDDHDHEEEEVENTFGYIGNSDAESDGGNVGFSLVGDNGFFGFSVSEVSKEYGLPIGVHAHAHHEEEHDDHGEDEDHDDHGEDHGDEHDEHEEEVEFVRIAMDKTRYDFKGELQLGDGFIQSIRASAGITDYMHDEIEIFEDGEREVGTRYENEGAEGRVTMTHVPLGNWNGVWGLQFTDNVFSATGEEAFIPESDITSVGFFGVERYTNGNLTGEIGIRFEDNSVDPNGRCDYSGNATSLSGSVLYDLGNESNLLFGASRSQRAPTVEELYSNVDAGSCAPEEHHEHLVLHAATNLLEVGNPMLEEETSANLEFGYRKYGGGFTGEFSAYHNQIDNFIFSI